MRSFSLQGIGGEKYPALTGVRALGAMIVFFDHFPLWPAYHLTVNVMAFFFTLSGFLIARIYYERAALTRTWLLKYFVNRFARIYPVYFLLLTIAVCLQRDFTPWTLITNYTLTHALFHGTELIIQPSWTLTVEESFYFLAPVFFVLAKRHSFWAPFAVAWMLLALALAVSKLGISFLGTPSFVISTTFFGNFVEFFAGFYLALALMNQEKRGALRMAGRRYTVAGLAGILVLVAAMIIVYRRVPLDLRAIMLINNFLIPVPIALLYWGLMREDTFLARILSNNVSGLLGRSSYSFYLLHMLIINYISIPWLLPWMGNRPLCIGLTLIIVWAASIALFVLYEEPVNIYIRGVFHSKDATVGMQQTLFPVRT
jgi:peptidoglycan/LPS O-acetylase OafA/YrhL